MRFSFENIFFRYVIILSVLALLWAAGLYVYLGTFSRYAGDDYCEAARISRSSPVAAVFERYFDSSWPRASMRYSNLLFVGISETFGRYKMPITMASMVLLWFAGNIWCMSEIRRFLMIDWAFQIDLFFGLTFGFFSLKQAPNLYETVYWRSAMMTHFAPLVFGLFLLAFLMKYARSLESKSASFLICFFIVLTTFVIAGFSEPPTTTLLTALPLLMFAVWFWEKSPAKQKYLALLTSVFVGAFLGLLAMLLSPSIANAAHRKSFDLTKILITSFLYSYQFLADSLRKQPLPFVLALLICLLFFWVYKQTTHPFPLSYDQKKIIKIVMMVMPPLALLLIAAGFSPSVYGQSFPVARTRFLAQMIVIAVFMLEGAFAGLLLGQFRSRTSLVGRVAAVTVFSVIAIGYPLRTAINMVRFDLPEYRTRAQKWDARDAYIREMKTEGVRDLIVPFLRGEIIQDLGDHKSFRLNRCASDIYGVNSILAMPIDNP